jgi:hypothetical protein
MTALLTEYALPTCIWGGLCFASLTVMERSATRHTDASDHLEGWNKVGGYISSNDQLISSSAHGTNT